MLTVMLGGGVRARAKVRCFVVIARHRVEVRVRVRLGTCLQAGLSEG